MDLTKRLIKLFVKNRILSKKESNNDTHIKDNIETHITENDHLIIYCPNCYSTDIQLLTEEQQITEHHFKYLCLVCRSRFDDETKTPFDFMVPPLDVWIQCWFLLGTTNSLEYIAAKLNLDMDTVRLMVQELKNTFSTQTLTRTTSYAEWAKQHSHIYAKRIKEEILTRKRKEHEMQQGISTNQPLDTAEIRRQQDRNKPTPSP